MKKRMYFFALVSTQLIIFIFTGSSYIKQHSFLRKESQFNGNRAYQDVIYQVALGPRTPLSEAHELTIDWIISELDQAGWCVEVNEGYIKGSFVQNIQATRSDKSPQYLLVAHYDSRLVADRDSDLLKRSRPVPGANDGATGVSVLLELARSLPYNIIPLGLLFTDMEDNGNNFGIEWALGAQFYVRDLLEKPSGVIVVDMVGDSDLQIYQEMNSDPALTTSIWNQADDLGYQHIFFPQYKYSLIDDHSPFIEAGIPSTLIIDFDYLYWHTSEDTIDKVSPKSLQVVGETLWHWIVNQR